MFFSFTQDSTPWLTWNLDPVLWLGIVAFVAAYFYAIGPLRRRYHLGPPATSRQIGYFLLGTLALALALVSPLDFIADHYLFSAHMIQHMLLVVVAPPLWLLGTPGWLLAPLFRRESVRQITRIIANPIVAFLLLNVDLYLWHIPPLYSAALTNEALHIVEHLTFIALGVLFWWVVLSPVEEASRVSRGVAILYLFLACQPMVLLGALLTFAPAPVYLTYVAAPRITPLSPLVDQQLGGLIMWLPSNIPYLLAISVFFFQWVAEQDRAERLAAGEDIGEGQEVQAVDAQVIPGATTEGGHA
jgi:cytochrome c oxidase assembly factor CtaG